MTAEQTAKREAFLKSLNKDFGKKGVSVKKANLYESFTDVVPLTSLAFSEATGVGGIPLGKIVELSGLESSGKSTSALDIIANLHKMNKDSMAVWIDSENSFDTAYAEALGVDTDRLEIPELGEELSLEDMYDLALKFVDSGLYSVVVIDSVTGFSPNAKIGDNTGGGLTLEARINSDKFKRFVNACRVNNCALIPVSQSRIDIGKHQSYGVPLTTGGGKAIGFYSHMRFEFTKKGVKAEGSYNIVKLKVIKNKLAPKLNSVAECTFKWGIGFDIIEEAVSYGKEFGILTGRINYKGEKIANSHDTAIEYFTEHPKKLAELREEIEKAMKDPNTVKVDAEKDEE